MTSVEVMMMMMMIMMMLQRASVLHKQLQAGLVFRNCHDTGIEDCVVGFQNGIRPMFTLWTFFDQCSHSFPRKRIRMCKLAEHDSSSKTARERAQCSPRIFKNRGLYCIIIVRIIEPRCPVQKCSLCLWNSCCTVTVPWYCEAAAAALLRPFYGRAGQCRGERRCRIAGLGYCRVMVSWQIQYCRFMVTWYHGR